MAPAVKFCFDSGDMILVGIAFLFALLFGMSIGAGWRKK